MGFREDLARKIEKKRAEIAVLSDELKTARTYLQALEDMHKLAGRGVASPDAAVSDSAPSFRPGTLIAGAYAALKASGRPMHVNELLPAMGREANRATKSALSGTLAPHVTSGDTFTRPAPNTFGLVEFGAQTVTEPVPPVGFGKL